MKSSLKFKEYFVEEYGFHRLYVYTVYESVLGRTDDFEKDLALIKAKKPDIAAAILYALDM